MNHAYQKLGELLLARELISPTQLEEALELQSKSGLRLGELLVRHGFVSEDAVASALAAQYGYEVVDPGSVYPTPEALDLLSFSEAASQCLLPIRTDDETIFCLVADPLNVPMTDQLASKHRKRVILAVAPDTKLKARIVEAYRGELNFQSSVPVRLPERFVRATPRCESNSIMWIDALDSFLDRPVSLFVVSIDSRQKDSHLAKLKASAKLAEDGVATVHDTFTFETSRITVLERLHGSQLSDLFRTGQQNAPAEAARTVSRVAKTAHDLGAHDPSWICAENVWLDGNAIKVAPVFSSKGDYVFESEVEALGNLLWQCLLGRQDCKIDFTSGKVASVPSGMILILQRCLSSQSDCFQTPAEVHNALSNYRWSSEGASPSGSPEMDRNELLSTLRVYKAPPKPSFWQKLFGRNAA